MSTLLVYGKYVVPDKETTIPSGAVYIEDGKIKDMGTYGELTARYRPSRILGDVDALVIPGLINAHGHGRGITDFQRGALDDTLEVWKFRRYPPIDPYWDTLWQCVLLLESGVTAVMHNHSPSKPTEAVEEMSRLLDAYRLTGMRVAFAPALSYVNTFVYGDQGTFLSTLDPDTRKLAEQIIQNSRVFGPENYFESIKVLSRAYDSERVVVHHGPMAPQWVEEDVLVEIGRRARSEGKMLFTHVQQTPQQYLYGFEKHGKTLIEWMAEKGLLGFHVALGHCVWITERDIRLLAESGCGVTHHPSCNLRVRNGISPVWYLRKAGVPVGIGMDDKEFGDDRDFIEETRMASKLHRVVDRVPGSPCLNSRDAFAMATEGGAYCLGWGSQLGKLRKGAPADLVVIDLGRMTEPYTFPGHDPIEVLLQRGRKTHVRHVVLGGEVVLEEGILTKIDKREVLTRLKESIPEDYAERFQSSWESFRPLKQALHRWFQEKDAETWTVWKGQFQEPFYRMNARGE